MKGYFIDFEKNEYFGVYYSPEFVDNSIDAFNDLELWDSDENNKAIFEATFKSKHPAKDVDDNLKFSGIPALLITKDLNKAMQLLMKGIFSSKETSTEFALTM